ncbi:hypothetical protein [Pantanalinema sp. GBBB05]|uniref:hypothetical protein n=1 Tax=Pantanalinema sp. GBBB05 TaxID=2604139 RepID=UPI003D812A25
MTEPTTHLPKAEHEAVEQQPVAANTVDPQDLVYSGGYTKDPREIVENPAVTPEMLNEPGDLRSDALEED